MKNQLWQERLREGRDLPEVACKDAIRLLAGDPRFAGLIGHLMRQRDGWADAVADQALAGNPGKLTHCAGSLHAVRTLLRDLQQIVEKGPSERTPAPGE